MNFSLTCQVKHVVPRTTLTYSFYEWRWKRQYVSYMVGNVFIVYCWHFDEEDAFVLAGIKLLRESGRKRDIDREWPSCTIFSFSIA